MKKITFFVFLMALCGILTAQNSSPLLYKWDPEFSFVHQATPKWSFKVALGGLYRFAATGVEPTFGVQKLDRIEIDFAVKYKMPNKRSATVDYKLRRLGNLDTAAEGFEHRFTEFFVLPHSLGECRMAHRFQLEQRLKESYENRFRYRIRLDVPLRRREEADKGETYLFFSDELVFAFNLNDINLENRIVPGIGWKLANGNKLEIGAEHRYAGGGEPQNLHILTSYSYKF